MIFIEISTLEHSMIEQQKWYKGIQVSTGKKRQYTKLLKDYNNNLELLTSSADELNRQIHDHSTIANLLRYDIR